MNPPTLNLQYLLSFLAKRDGPQTSSKSLPLINPVNSTMSLVQCQYPAYIHPMARSFDTSVDRIESDI